MAQTRNQTNKKSQKTRALETKNNSQQCPQYWERWSNPRIITQSIDLKAHNRVPRGIRTTAMTPQSRKAPPRTDQLQLQLALTSTTYGCGSNCLNREGLKPKAKECSHHCEWSLVCVCCVGLVCRVSLCCLVRLVIAWVDTREVASLEIPKKNSKLAPCTCWSWVNNLPFLFCWWKSFRVSKATIEALRGSARPGRDHASDAKQLAQRQSETYGDQNPKDNDFALLKGWVWREIKWQEGSFWAANFGGSQEGQGTPQQETLQGITWDGFKQQPIRTPLVKVEHPIGEFDLHM